jgi:5-formyltetrahydrofolate cyclo-ligase
MESSKKELRAKYKARSQLSENDIETMRLLPTSYLHFLFGRKRISTFFYPLQNKEVDTELILHLLSGKDKEIIISKADFNSLKMTHFL